MIRRIRPPLLLALATVLVCWKPIFHREFTLLAGSDMARAYFPYFDAAAYWFKRGVLLLWDPYVYAGKPNMGEPQPGLYYPLNWIFFLLPSRDGGINLDGMQALLVLDFFFAVCCTYALARSCGLTGRGSAVAAIAFAFGGCTVQLYGYVNKFSGFVWMPLALLCFRRALDAGGGIERARWVAASGLVVALTFLPGHHIPAVHTGLLLSGYAVFALLYGWSDTTPRRRLAIAGALAAAAVVAALLTAVQWIPSAEWARKVYRWVGEGDPLLWRQRVPYAVLEHTGNQTPQNALSFLFPYLSTDANLYIGAAVTFFAIAGLLYGRRREAHFFGAAAVVYFFLSWGRFSVLHGWLNTFVPGVWFAREVFHYLVPLQLCVAMLAGFGADRLASAFGAEADPAARLFARRGGWTAALAGLGALAAAGALHFAEDVALDHPHLTGLGGLSAYALVLALLLFLLHNGRVSPSRFQTLAVALVLVDLASHFSASIPTKNPPAGTENTYVRSFWTKPPAARFLLERRAREIFRVDDPSNVFPQNFGDVWRIDETMGHGATALVDYFALRGTGWHPASNASALLNVRYVPSRVPIGGMTKVFDEGIAVYENSRALPRFFLASSAKLFASQDALLPWLESPLFDPRRTALLLERDAAALPKEIRRERDPLGLEIVHVLTAARKRGEALDDPAERQRLQVCQPPWGQSAGDEVVVGLRPQARVEHCFLAVDYVATAAAPGTLAARLSGPAGGRDFAIPLEPSQGGKRAVLDLGALDAAAYRLVVERTADCDASVERVSISTDPSEPAQEAGTVEIGSHAPNRIVLTADVRRASLLIASEVYYPGWEAWVDDERAPVLRVDHALRAVPLAPGRHIVKLRFRSGTFQIGLAVSLVSAALLAAFLVRTRRRT